MVSRVRPRHLSHSPLTPSPNSLNTEIHLHVVRHLTLCSLILFLTSRCMKPGLLIRLINNLKASKLTQFIKIIPHTYPRLGTEWESDKHMLINSQDEVFTQSQSLKQCKHASGSPTSQEECEWGMEASQSPGATAEDRSLESCAPGKLLPT